MSFPHYKNTYTYIEPVVTFYIHSNHSCLDINTPIQLEQHHTIKATPAQFAFLDNYCHLMQHNKLIRKTNYLLAPLCEPKTIWKQNFQAYEKKKMVTICEDGWKKEVIKPCTSQTLVVWSPDMAHFMLRKISAHWFHDSDNYKDMKPARPEGQLTAKSWWVSEAPA